MKAHMLLKRILQEVHVYGRLRQRRRLKRKELAALHQVIFQVVFSLLLAFFEPLEGSAVKEMHRM